MLRKSAWFHKCRRTNNWTKTINSTNMLPLDNANGGVYNLELFIPASSGIGQYVLEPRFNFIPTYSSLDVGSGNTTIIPSDLTKKI